MNEGNSKKYARLTTGYKDSNSLSSDELWTKQGLIRPHWRDFMKAQERLGPEEIDARKNELERLLRENGVTYNAYSDGLSLNRPWDLDPCPLILDGDEWANIAPALIQRGELLNEIYKDIYGPQKLIKDKLIPADLIFQHPGFCRPAMHLELPGKYKLMQCAFNLVRGTDNQWWVLSDRLQASQGSGYALETRLAMSRVYPNLIRHCQVQRLAGYFRDTHQGLVEVSETDDPHIVILSPGPKNESYFEDAYLANYQGYTLVQGDDLVVRDGYVWLKTLHGLKKVDVILRRISDQLTDPLELRPDSFIGVPGLIESIRQRKIIVVNPLGTWLIESPGLYPFLDKCCQHLLNEPLKMPSAATWWCGQTTACDHVIKNLDGMVIKHTSDRLDITFGHLLSTTEKQRLIDRIKAEPGKYVGQQMLNISTMPSWIDHQLQPRHGFLRTFVSANKNGYQVMPGGLACNAHDSGQNIVSPQAGAVNKDTWVRATDKFPLIPFTSNVHSSAPDKPQQIAISSRTAENLFWLGRYSQRAEIVARMMRQVVNSYFDDASDSDEVSTTAILFFDALQAFTGYKIDDTDKTSSDAEQPELTSKIYEIAVNPRIDRGLNNILRNLYQSAFHSRDVWSAESWRVINEISDVMPTLRRDQRLVMLQHSLDNLLRSLMALNGLIADSMNHDDGWRMLDIGRLMERSLNLSHVIGFTITKNTKTNESEILSALLSSNDNIMNFRRYHRSEIDIHSVLDYLLLNKFNPRGMVYQLTRLQGHIHKLFDGKNSGISSTEKPVLSAYTQIQLAEISYLATRNEIGDRPALIKLMRQIHTALEITSNELSNHCFVHTQTSRSSEWAGRLQ